MCLEVSWEIYYCVLFIIATVRLFIQNKVLDYRGIMEKGAFSFLLYVDSLILKCNVGLLLSQAAI